MGSVNRLPGLLLSLLLTLSSAQALANACYIGSDGSDELIFLSDVNDASTARVVGSFGVPNIETMAKDPVTQNLYSADANTLGIVDQDTGVYTTIGSFGTALAANGDLTNNVNLSDIDSLAFHPITGELFGVQNSSSRGILFQINPCLLYTSPSPRD